MSTGFIAEIELSRLFAENYSLWGGRRVDMDDDWELSCGETMVFPVEINQLIPRRN